MTSLQDIQSPSHIPFTQRHEGIHGFGSDLDSFPLNHLLDQAPDIGFFQGTESKACTSRQQRWRKFVGVVRDDTESGVGRVFLHDSSEGHLRRGRHGVGFVEDDEFVGREGGSVGLSEGGAEDLFGAFYFA